MVFAIVVWKNMDERKQLLGRRHEEGKHAENIGLTFLFSFVIAFNLAMFLNDSKTTTSWGAIAGFLAGFGGLPCRNL